MWPEDRLAEPGVGVVVSVGCLVVDELLGQVPLFSIEDSSLISLPDVDVNRSLEEIRKGLH